MADTRTRAQRNRAIRQENLRQELKARSYLDQIHGILEHNYLGAEMIELQAAKLKLDGYFKLLNKVLPDLKAVEVTGENGGAVQFENLSDDDLDIQIKQVAEQAGIVVALGRAEKATH